MKRFARFLVALYVLTIIFTLIPSNTVQAALSSSIQEAYNNHIRVLITYQGKPQGMSFTVNASYLIDGSDTYLHAGTKYSVAIGGSGLRIKDDSGKILHEASSKIVLRPVDEPNGLITVGSYNYRGNMEFHRYTESGRAYVQPIAHLPLETYLVGVLPYEMSDSWPLEALKSQAVVARTFALRHMYAKRGRDWHVDDTTSFQVFKGYNKNHKNAIRAIEETKGIVLEYGNYLANVTYGASNGGYTEASENVWTSADPVLRSFPDEADTLARTVHFPHLAYTWSHTLKVDDRNGEKGLRGIFRGAIGDNGLSIGEFVSIDIDNIVRNESGSIREMKIIGTDGVLTLKKERPRNAFKDYRVRSTKYDIKYIPDERYAGSPKSGAPIQNFKAKLIQPINSMGIRYQAYVKGLGWQDWSYDGDDAVKTLSGQPIQGLKMELVDAPAGWKLQYRVYVEGQGWQNWTENGHIAGSGETTSPAIEAVEMRTVPSGTAIDLNRGFVSYQIMDSTQAWSEKVDDSPSSARYELSGVGYGHGVGMSQIGAYARARDYGHNYREILSFYFPGVTFETLLPAPALPSAPKPKPKPEPTPKPEPITPPKLDPPPVPKPDPGEFSIIHVGHSQRVGWQDWVKGDDISGTTGKALRLEALKIQLLGEEPGMGVKYRTYVEGTGWQSWMSNGDIAGTQGQSKRIEAIAIALDNVPGYSVQYQVHMQGVGWMDWVEDGQVAGLPGSGKRIEAIRIKLSNTSSSPEREPSLTYRAHVQSDGWQPFVKEGEMAGTEGRSLRLEALEIKLLDAPKDMKIKYRAHVEKDGWQSWVYGDHMAGTVGRSLRLEAIQIELEGAPPGYSIEYRAHVQGIGWQQDWVPEGSIAGTTGQGKRLEAIEIRLIKK